MHYVLTDYEVVNGSKQVSRAKNKPFKNIAYIDKLQSRAERLWRHIHKEEDLCVYINYKCPIEKHIPWKDDEARLEKLKKRNRILKKK